MQETPFFRCAKCAKSTDDQPLFSGVRFVRLLHASLHKTCVSCDPFFRCACAQFSPACMLPGHSYFGCQVCQVFCMHPCENRQCFSTLDCPLSSVLSSVLFSVTTGRAGRGPLPCGLVWLSRLNRGPPARTAKPTLTQTDEFRPKNVAKRCIRPRGTLELRPRKAVENLPKLEKTG
jgi:hypothetical protein